MYNKYSFFLICFMAGWIAACSIAGRPVPPSKLGDDIKEHPAVQAEDTGVDARATASSELLFRACERLGDDRVDDAIDLLERAIALDPKEGRNYYYLAEGWIRKGNASQAFEYNHLAEIYLDYDSDWLQKVQDQKELIRRLE